ncbi:MAG: NADH-quinone oxidoreductase subunit K [Anaerolineae bacterium]|nr:NADH-quinone oxidoreductase subunit K [Anaerolineae bacterium]
MMTEVSPASIALIGVLGLFGVGLYGLLALRNLIKVVIALQLLIKAAVLALVAAGGASGQVNLGQSLAATVIVVDTIVAVVGLALAVQVRRRFGTLDVRVLSELRE